MDRIEFWDRKILPWEAKNYQGKAWGAPIRSRRSLFLELARDSLRGKTVLELGCGSAGLLSDLFEAGVTRYIGCDFSPVAIAQARLRAASLGLTDRVELLPVDIEELPRITHDFSFSLGLLDWIEDDELVRALGGLSSRYFLHSYSEKRRSVPQLLHRAYVYSAYGRKTQEYVPRYRETRDILRLFTEARMPLASVFTHRQMSFSAFALHLP